ncbi:hypothetical protein K5D56_08800 [Pseudomonas cichorii]|uniref:hypothetical protein n=1 Tax=Pseudomonas cichorii TaxID=36746 RepID=UPI00190FCB52|nr:hypothetical protein [Pseudomonas cichorii]MBX8539118.1 hypothetical protein [Pseudomonas cichorii]MBX8545924.1 hypothetical protein [Pseudomonas cichorii]MBX8560286.1 hypothetical protein [Pseudomonas cichorii]MBX8564546.1 hypothetical protein [Pseudomonas cichorii]MBX8579046.1 hypothetical protein [Pseudomonas cichorii]
MKVKKRSARSQRIREQRRLNLQRYWLDFYRARYRAKVMGIVSMMVLMAGVSLYTRSMMPLYLVTPIAVTGVLMLTWFWRKRIGLVADDPAQPE